MCSRSSQYVSFDYHQKLLSQKWSYAKSKSDSWKNDISGELTFLEFIYSNQTSQRTSHPASNSIKQVNEPWRPVGRLKGGSGGAEPTQEGSDDADGGDDGDGTPTIFLSDQTPSP